MIAVLWFLGCGTADVALPQNPLLSIEKLSRISFDGTVAERIEAGGYTYLRLEDGKWVVGLEHGHQPGDRVTVLPIGLARDFVSARTGRTFDTLLFAVVSAKKDEVVPVGTGS